MRGRKPNLETIRKSLAEPYTGPSPACPVWLDDDARTEWDRVTPELIRQGLLTPADVSVLAAYCQAWSQWMQCELQIKTDGLMVPGSNGNMVLHPAARHRIQLMGELRKAAAEFGFTPAARTRVVAPPREGAESDDFEAM